MTDSYIKLTKPVGQKFHDVYLNPMHIVAIEDVSTENRTGCEIYTIDGRHTFVEESVASVLECLSLEGSSPDSGTPTSPLPEILGSGA